MPTTHYPQFCALARATEIIGERWTLLIVRDLLNGPKRFSDLNKTLHGITPAVLTSRINQMQEAGLIEKQSGPRGRSTAYSLTPIGLALRPAIDALILWGGHFLFPVREDDRFSADWVTLALTPVARTRAVPALKARLSLVHGEECASIFISGGATGTMISDDSARALKPDVEIVTSFDVALQFLGGFLPLKQGLKEGSLDVKGRQKDAALLPALFDFTHLHPST